MINPTSTTYNFEFDIHGRKYAFGIRGESPAEAKETLMEDLQQIIDLDVQ